MSEQTIRRQLTEYLDYPRESLDVEVKQWLDPTLDDDKATIAKEILALANHGGGTLVIGYREDGEKLTEDENRPLSLKDWSQDTVQGIVSRYAEPSFEVRVRHVASTHTGQLYPVISVPGGHRTPILAKRSSPDQKKIVLHRIYTRRPGPCSEEPKTADEWSALLARCLTNRQDELLAVMRGILGGYNVPSISPDKEATLEQARETFVAKARDAWRSLVDSLPEGSPARFSHGHYEAVFQYVGEQEQHSLADSLRIIEQAVTRNSGWPAFVTLQRNSTRPRNVDGNIQSWFPPEERELFNGPQYNDFWRIDPTGLLYLRRGYSEDGTDKAKPGTVFDLTVPIWRVADAIHQARNILVGLNGDAGVLVGTFHYTGLQGRRLVALESNRYLSHTRTSASDAASSKFSIDLTALPTQLPEVVHQVLRPVFEIFDFFELPKSVVDQEVEKYLKNRF